MKSTKNQPISNRYCSAMQCILNESLRRINELIAQGAAQSIAEAKRALEMNTVPFITPEEYAEALSTTYQQSLYQAVEKWRVNTFDVACTNEVLRVVERTKREAVSVFSDLKDIKVGLNVTSTVERDYHIDISQFQYPFAPGMIKFSTKLTASELNGKAAAYIKQQISGQLSQDTISTMLREHLLQTFTRNMTDILVALTAKTEYEASALEKLHKDLEKDQRNNVEIKQKLEKFQQFSTNYLKGIIDPAMLKVLYKVEIAEEPTMPFYSKYNPKPNTANPGLVSVAPSSKFFLFNQTITVFRQEERSYATSCQRNP
jgi:hypothetical protein